jgi:hypothetical protein
MPVVRHGFPLFLRLGFISNIINRLIKKKHLLSPISGVSPFGNDDVAKLKFSSFKRFE